MSPGRVAVTGATGFIGWHICERLRDCGWRVVAVVRPDSSKPVPAGVETRRAPLDAPALGRAFDGTDAVVHAAGIVRAPSAAGYAAVNVAGTRAAMDAAQSVGARLIQVSSLTAAGPASAEQPRLETDESRPVTEYGRSKLAAEDLLNRTFTLRWTIVRPAAVYGPRDRQFLPLFQAARAGLFLRLPNAARFSLTLVHVEDVARAIEMACRSDGIDGDTLFVGHPVPASFDAMLKAVASAVGRRYRPLPIPFALARVGAWLGIGGLSAERLQEVRSPGFVCRVEHAKERLGFQAQIDLEEGFRRTAMWYGSNRWLR